MILYNNLRFFDKWGNDLNPQLTSDINVTLSVESVDNLGFNAVLSAVVDETGTLKFIDVIHGGNGFSNGVNILITIYDNIKRVETVLSRDSGDITISIVDTSISSIGILVEPTDITYPAQEVITSIPMGLISTNLIESEEFRILEEVAIYNSTTTKTELGWVYPRGGANDIVYLSWDDTNESDEEEYNLFSVDKDEEYGWIKKNETQEFEFADGTGDSYVNIDGRNYRRILFIEKDTNVIAINIMFMSKDVGTFERTLGFNIVHTDIDKTQYLTFNFTAETEAVDERFGNLLQNFARDFPNEKEFLLRDSDIFEALTDNVLLNEKKKELLIEGDNIYPYIGSYKALINFLNWAGYDDLKIKEYWLNLDATDGDFKKYKHQEIPFDILQEGGTITRETLPSKKFKKTNLFGLYYNINQVTNDVDQWGIPIVEDTFMFSIEEVLIKLFGLKQYLKHNFLPLNARIIDITGEGIYFERYSLNAWTDGTAITSVDAVRATDFNILPENPYIIDLRVLGDYDYRIADGGEQVVLEWNVGIDPNTSFVYDADVIENAVYNVGDDLPLYFYISDGINNGGVWSPPSLGYVNKDKNIIIEFKVNELKSIDILDLSFMAGQWSPFGPGFETDNFRLDYQINNNEIINLIDFPDGDISINYETNPKSFNENLNITLDSGDLLKIIWSPYNADIEFPDGSSGGFYIKDDTVKLTGIIYDVIPTDPLLDSTVWNNISSTVVGYYDNINNTKIFADEPDAPIGAPIVLSMTLFDVVWNDLNSTPWDYYNADGGELTPVVNFGTGTVTDIIINNVGAGYTSDPLVNIIGGLDVASGFTAKAHVELSGGKIVNVVIDNPGSGYISQPSVVLIGGFPDSLLNTWDTLGVGEFYELEWRVTSDDGIFKYSKRGRIDAMFEHTAILPYVGTYTVEMVLYDTDNNNYNLFKESAITVHSYEAEYCAYSVGGEYIQTWNDQDFTWDEAENFGYTWINPILNSGSWDDMQISWDELEMVNNNGDNSVYPNTVDTGLLGISERDVSAGSILTAVEDNVILTPVDNSITFDATNQDYINFSDVIYWLQDVDDFEINIIVSNVDVTTDGQLAGRGGGSADNGWAIKFDFANLKLIFDSTWSGTGPSPEVLYADIPFSDPQLDILVKRNATSLQIYINDILKFDSTGADDSQPIEDVPLSIGAYRTGVGVGASVLDYFTGTVHYFRVDKTVLDFNEGSGSNVKATNLQDGLILTSNAGGYTYIDDTMWTTVPETVTKGLNITVSFPLIQPILKKDDYVYFRKSGQILRTQLLTDTELKEDLTIGKISVDGVTREIDSSWEFLSNIGSTIITEIYDDKLVNFKPGDYITFKKPKTAYTVSMLPVIEPIYNIIDTIDTDDNKNPLILSGCSISNNYDFKTGERCGIYQFRNIPDIAGGAADITYVVDAINKTITITSNISLKNQFIPGFSTIDLYRKEDFADEFIYKQILLVTAVEESGSFVIVLNVDEIDGNLSYYTAYADSYMTYKYNAFQTEILSTTFDGTDTTIEMNINEYPMNELFAPQFFDPAFIIEDNWFFDYSVVDGEYSLEIVAVGTEGGFPYIQLDDVDSELYMTSTGFIIDNNTFNIDRANKHIGTDPTWDKMNDMTWNEAYNMTWDEMIFNKPVISGFKITDIGINGTIQFNVDPIFTFQTITAGMTTVLERLQAGLIELNETTENGLSGFTYFISTDETFIQAVSKDKSPNNLGALDFTNGVTGEWVMDDSKSHSYPVNNYYTQSWQDGFFGENNADPDWDFLYTIYKEYGLDPIGNKGWYPASDIPAEYKTDGYDWYSAGIPYQKPVGGSLTWNDLNISKAELYVNNFSTVFINANRSKIPGKIAYNIELYTEGGELLVKSTSSLLIWLFTNTGRYNIKTTIWDNNLNKIMSERQNAIIVG